MCHAINDTNTSSILLLLCHVVVFKFKGHQECETDSHTVGQRLDSNKIHECTCVVVLKLCTQYIDTDNSQLTGDPMLGRNGAINEATVAHHKTRSLQE